MKFWEIFANLVKFGEMLGNVKNVTNFMKFCEIERISVKFEEIL